MSNSSKLAQSGVQPWHIVVLVVAAALGIWQLGRFAVTAKASGDVKVVKQQPDNGNVGAVANTPQSATQQRAAESYRKVIADKDADSSE
jgi:cytochrome oxidase assembly protein ShyY1